MPKTFGGETSRRTIRAVDGYSPTVGQRETVDAVVIGAGHNGLVAANMLADAHWNVVVLEATGQPGGAVRSGHLAPGYLSDHCSAFFPLAAVSPALESLSLADFGLRWRQAPAVLAHLLEDGRAAVLGRDVSATGASVETFAAGDAQRWRDVYTQWRQWRGPLLRALFEPFPPVRAGVNLLLRTGAADGLRLARRMLLPARVLSGELFAGEGASLLLSGCAMHTDLGIDEPGSGIYGWLLAMVAQESGFPVPEGGAQRITDALVARLRQRGGRVLPDTPVARIHVRHGRAGEVSSADGRRWVARRAVLADVPAPLLYLDLIGERWLPPRLAEDLRHFRWDGSTVKVDWALRSTVPWANPAVAAAGTVHLGADLNGLTRYSAELACGRVPREPFLLAGQMTVADPQRSPAGTESVWAYTHLPHRRQWHADEVAEHAERMQAVMERHAPGFGALIEARRVSGPAELQADNPSLLGGAVGGGTAAIYQQLFLRPVPGLGRADTPIEGLYTASSSSHPGGGVHGVPGANAARAALAANRPMTGALYRAALTSAQRAINGRARRS